MKNHFRVLVIMASIFVSTNPSFAQWVQTSGPQSDEIRSFEISGENIFAGTNTNGIFLSTNYGAKWTSLNNGLTGVAAVCFATIDSNYFVGTDGAGVFLSTDYGKSGVAVNTGLTNSHVSSLAVCGNILFANTWGGLFLSKNNGTSWAYINQLNNLTGGPLLVNQNTNGSSSIYVGDYTGIYCSTDSGSSWTKLNNPPTNASNPDITALIVITDNTGRKNLFAGTWGEGVFLSSDNGTNWIECNDSLGYFTFVNGFAVRGSNLFVAENIQSDSGGVFLSTNYGITWTSKNSGLKNRDVNVITSIGNYLLAGTSGGVFISTDNGTNWIQANNGLSYLYGNSFALNGKNLYTGTDNGGLFLSTNNGSSWSQINDNSTVFPITAITISGNNIFAGTTQGTYRSTNNGVTWSLIDNIYVNGTYISTGMASNECVWSLINIPTGTNSSNIFAGTVNDGILLSTNNGDHWDPVNNGLWSDTRDYIVYALAIGSNLSGGINLYSGMGNQGLADYGDVYLSNNNAASWTLIGSGLPSKAIWALATNGNTLFAGTNGAGIFRSTDYGASWNAVNTGLTGTKISAFAINGKDIFAGSYDGGVFRSSNNGDSWSQINENLSYRTVSQMRLYKVIKTPQRLTQSKLSKQSIPAFADEDITILPINALAVDSTYLYAGTLGDGVWKRPLSEITAIEHTTNELPTQFSLSQNYPNPFNPATTINYSVPKKSLVTIKVYDVLGREIATLVDGDKFAGNYSVEFSANNGYTSGVYFYRMEAGTFAQTKKLLIVK